MNQQQEMRNERIALEQVKMRLIDTIDASRALSSQHEESLRRITADAWEDLRVRPTAISQIEMQQLATEYDRFTARKAFAEEEARRAEKMLPKPYFGRIDFREDGASAPEQIRVRSRTRTVASWCTTGARPFAGCITIRCPAAPPIAVPTAPSRAN